MKCITVEKNGPKNPRGLKNVLVTFKKNNKTNFYSWTEATILNERSNSMQEITPIIYRQVPEGAAKKKWKFYLPAHAMLELPLITESTYSSFKLIPREDKADLTDEWAADRPP